MFKTIYTNKLYFNTGKHQALKQGINYDQERLAKAISNNTIILNHTKSQNLRNLLLGRISGFKILLQG